MRTAFLAVAAVLLAGGCSGSIFPGGASPDYVKPSIAVMKFENRASFSLGWDLGDGMKDILVDRLVSTDRFQVIERPELDSVTRELSFQQTGATRRENRAKLGRIKNVEYLIKGVITDFGHVSTTSGFLGWSDNLDIFGAGHRAVVSMTLYVVDVESGEIICSESITESVRAKDMTVQAAYKDVGMGGSVFHRTPLGRVTARVIDEAVGRISKTVAARPWQPKIAQVAGHESVIINGGANRKVAVGSEYEVVELGAPIVDPDTGDVIGTGAGEVVGRLRVCEVKPRYAVTQVVTGFIGDMKVGQHCRPAATAPESASRAAPDNEPRLGAR